MLCDVLFEDLIHKIRLYHPAKKLSLIEKAYRTASEAHEGQVRKSGEPYLVHPLSVAVILAELELDLESIAAGILHDVVEDTALNTDDIIHIFSGEIAALVDGVTKLEKIQYTSKAEEQAANYRKMFLAMASDIRVILIKIADRLHNLRTLMFQPPEKQREVAQETLDIYAPLTNRLGISKLRYELEDLSFRYSDPFAYNDIAEKITMKQSERQALIQRIVDEIGIILHGYHIRSSVEGRPKHFFSIYKKMVGKDKTLDQIFDLFAVRVLVDEPSDCYAVLGLLHEAFMPVPGRFKDYVAAPKPNRYQSLHTTLISHEGEPFEVQIRTWEMHRSCEYGIAAHWKYKSGKGGNERDKEEEKLNWLQQMLEWQREMPDNAEYLEALKTELDVYKDQVLCFTPKGDVITLMAGSTPIDFAYAIHSAVGNRMVGARVNGRLVTFDCVLETGDRVEIITSQNSKGPSRDWIKLVKTAQARNKINQWFRQENRTENVQKGKELLEKEAKKKGKTLAELLSNGRETIVLDRFNCPDLESLYATVGHGGLKEGQIINKLFDEYQKDNADELDEQEFINGLLVDETDLSARNRVNKSGVVVEGVGDTNVRFSKCCRPLPGDEIIGFVTRGRGVSIHRSDCVNVINLDELNRMRLIEAQWGHSGEQDTITYRAELRITGSDRVGLLMDISRVLSDERVRVTALIAKTSSAEAIISVSLEIFRREQLDKVCAKILRQQGVHDIERVTA